MEIISNSVYDDNLYLNVNFTGQRPKDLYQYNPKDCMYVNYMLAIVVEKIVREAKSLGYIGVTFKTGLAQGIDQSAYCAVESVKSKLKAELNMDIQNHVYIPFIVDLDKYFSTKYNPEWVSKLVKRSSLTADDIEHLTGQEVRWAPIGLYSQKNYRDIINNADVIKVIDVFEYAYQTSDSSIVAHSLELRNKTMVYDSKVTLAGVGNNFSYPKKGSGTWNCIRDALDYDNNVIMIKFPKYAPSMGEPGTAISQDMYAYLLGQCDFFKYEYKSHKFENLYNGVYESLIDKN